MTSERGERITWAKAGDIYIRVEDVQAVGDAKQGPLAGQISNVYLRHGQIVVANVSAYQVMEAIDKAVEFR